MIRHILLGALLPAGLHAQAPTCRLALDSLDSKVRQNYAGFLLEVKGPRHDDYRSMLQRVEGEADRSEFERCYTPLSRYIDWFADPHLFVFQNQQTDSATAIRQRESIQHVSLTEDGARKLLSVRLGALEPIEGIWYDGPLWIAVVPDSTDPLRRLFIGVVVASDTSAWPVGSVRASFFRRDDGSYGTLLHTPDFAQLQLTARVHKRVLLRFSPGIWGKAWPLSPADTGLLDPVDPRRPRVSLRSQSVLISITSHDPTYVRVIDSLVKAFLPAIRDKGVLLVDLRGNEGGSSFTTRSLNPVIASTDKRVTRFDSGQAVMLSSPAQIAYAKRFTGTDTSAFVRRLVARMEANPGRLVLMDPDAVPSPAEPVTEGAWKVGVLVDGGTVSASEVTVLHALRSRRATVFGEPTAGALDYQSVNIVGLGIGDRRWALGYPAITAHADLPERGMRGRGIAPDVIMRWTDRADPVRDVEERLVAKP